MNAIQKPSAVNSVTPKAQTEYSEIKFRQLKTDLWLDLGDGQKAVLDPNTTVLTTRLGGTKFIVGYINPVTKEPCSCRNTPITEKDLNPVAEEPERTVPEPAKILSDLESARAELQRKFDDTPRSNKDQRRLYRKALWEYDSRIALSKRNLNRAPRPAAPKVSQPKPDTAPVVDEDLASYDAYVDSLYSQAPKTTQAAQIPAPKPASASKAQKPAVSLPEPGVIDYANTSAFQGRLARVFESGLKSLDTNLETRYEVNYDGATTYQTEVTIMPSGQVVVNGVSSRESSQRGINIVTRTMEQVAGQTRIANPPVQPVKLTVSVRLIRQPDLPYGGIY